MKSKRLFFEAPTVMQFSPERVRKDIWLLSKGKPTTMEPSWLAYHAYTALYGEYRAPARRPHKRKPRYQREGGLLVMGVRKGRAGGEKSVVCPVVAFPR